MNINFQPKKCSSQSRYSRYDSYATYTTDSICMPVLFHPRSYHLVLGLTPPTSDCIALGNLIIASSLRYVYNRMHLSAIDYVHYLELTCSIDISVIGSAALTFITATYVDCSKAVDAYFSQYDGKH